MAEFVRFTLDDGSEVLFESTEGDLVALHGGGPPEVREGGKLTARLQGVAEAAEEQGKFWLMHDRLFEHQSELGEALYRKLARELPLDLEVFDRDLRSGEAARRVDEDVESGIEAGVVEAPTLFVNGRMHVGPHEFDDLLAALQRPRAGA